MKIKTLTKLLVRATVLVLAPLTFMKKLTIILDGGLSVPRSDPVSYGWKRQFSVGVGKHRHTSQALMSLSRFTSWVRWIAAASLFAWCGVAEANVIPYYDALVVVQDWTLSWENSVAYQDLYGPIATYYYRADNSDTGWSGSLTGATLAVTYAGDASSYDTTGRMSWEVTGTVGGTPYAGTGTAQFTDVPGDTSFSFTINATEGGANLNFIMTGLVEEFAPGQPVVNDASTWGALSRGGGQVFSGGDWVLYPSGDDYKTPGGGWSAVKMIPSGGTTIGELVVPEPSTVVLLVAGALGLLGARLFAQVRLKAGLAL